MLGLAVGDARGASIEFSHHPDFAPVFEMRGGGPHHLLPGQFTDDTSMALCLADSLLARQGFDGEDQLRRYASWWRDGLHSSTGACFDVGGATRDALERFLRQSAPACGSDDPMTAGNGSIMRLAPVPLFFRGDPEAAVAYAAKSSETTHRALEAVDGCRYLAALLLGALAGTAKAELLASDFEPVPDLWRHGTLCPGIAQVAQGGYKAKRPPAIDGGGYVVSSLESARWAFHHGDSFLGGLYLAVNLGNDADTTGAVYGQLAGAYYGEDAIPADWRQAVERWAAVGNVADRLLTASTQH